MKKTITEEMILNGLNKGVLRLSEHTNVLTDDTEVVCQFGTDWFYFINNKDDKDLDLSSFLDKYTREKIAEQITFALTKTPLGAVYEELVWTLMNIS